MFLLHWNYLYRISLGLALRYSGMSCEFTLVPDILGCPWASHLLQILWDVRGLHTSSRYSRMSLGFTLVPDIRCPWASVLVQDILGRPWASTLVPDILGCPWASH